MNESELKVRPLYDLLNDESLGRRRRLRRLGVDPDVLREDPKLHAIKSPHVSQVLISESA
jgi:hypothetical protein